MAPVRAPSGKGEQSLRGRELATAYRSAALLLLNISLAFALLNLLALIALALHERWAAPAPGPLAYGLERLSRVYPHRTPAEIDSLLRETWGGQLEYAPLVQHRERPRNGSWVNVSRDGFRLSADQGAWPPPPGEVAVFFYGGSTAFGYGLADEETIPSRLQEMLNGRGCDEVVRIYNFGRGNYYGEQERALFESHLAAGHRPAAAVFLDGLNEWQEEPKFTRRLAYMMDEGSYGLWRRALGRLPLLALLRRVGVRGGGSEGTAPADDAAARGDALVARWLAGRDLIQAAGEAFGVSTLFVWQPIPTYRYELEQHPFAAESAAAFARLAPVEHAYSSLDSIRRERQALSAENGFLWLADLQVDRREPLYVDAAHYTEAFSREIAARIGDVLASWLRCGGESAGGPAPG